jgi:hypothetical protein
MRPRHLVLAAAAIAFIALAVFLIPRLNSERMLAQRFEALAVNIEQQAWIGFGGLVAEDYQDQWGTNRGNAIAGLRLVRQGFTSLDVRLETVSTRIDGLNATVTARVRLVGEGNAASVILLRRVNELEDPWTFTFRRTAWMPWTWDLVKTEQPTLSFQRIEGFGW